MVNRSGNRFQNTSPIGHDLMIVEAEDSEALRCEEGIAACIAFKMVRFKMLPAVDFNNQICHVAHKIRDVRTNWCLPSEARAVQPMST